MAHIPDENILENNQNLYSNSQYLLDTVRIEYGKFVMTDEEICKARLELLAKGILLRLLVIRLILYTRSKKESSINGKSRKRIRKNKIINRRKNRK
jgi:hypothetical protein